MEKNIKLSFVIPCYGSKNTILKVLNEIREMQTDESAYEIICVDDCSPDQVGKVLDEAAVGWSNLKVIHLAKNFGQHAALMAGYRVVTGDVIISLDDDGQTPVSQYPKLLNALDEDTDIVYAAYGVKKQSWFKNFGSSVNRLMLELLVKKPKDLEMNSYFVCRRYVVDEIVQYKSAYPYLGGLLLRTTNHIKNVQIEHCERLDGKTGYNFKKLFHLWLNGFTAFSIFPLRVSTFLGFLFAVFGFLFALFTIIRKLVQPSIAAGWSSIVSILLFVGGILMILIGMVGEYVGRIYISQTKAPQYVIRDTRNCEIADQNAQRPKD